MIEISCAVVENDAVIDFVEELQVQAFIGFDGLQSVPAMRIKVQEYPDIELFLIKCFYNGDISYALVEKHTGKMLNHPQKHLCPYLQETLVWMRDNASRLYQLLYRSLLNGEKYNQSIP